MRVEVVFQRDGRVLDRFEFQSPKPQVSRLQLRGSLEAILPPASDL
jgi:hypothetical protein